MGPEDVEDHMSQRLTVAALAVAGLGLTIGAGNAWTLAGLNGQVRALELQIDALELHAEPEPRRVSASGGGHPAGRRAAAVSGPRPDNALAMQDPERPPRRLEDLDISDPEVQDRILDKLEENAQRREQDIVELRDVMRDAVDRFAREESLDEPTRRGVLSELKRRVEVFESIRVKVRSGGMTLGEARSEIDVLRDQSEATLEGLLGAGALARLERGLQAERIGFLESP
jgi:hypothetical protein